MRQAALTVMGTYALPLTGALVLAFLIRRLHDAYRRAYLRDWYRSFLALGVYVGLAGLSFLSVGSLPAWHPIRLALSTLALAAGYLQVLWLLSGTWACRTGREAPAGVVRGLVVGAVLLAAGLSLLFTWDPEATTARLVARVGVRSGVAAAGFWTAGYTLLRRDGSASSIGARVVGGAFVLYGFDQLLLFLVPVSGLVSPLTPGGGVLVGSLDLFLLAAVGLGLVAWFLDEERARALRISEALRGSEERFRLLVRHTGQLLYEHDPARDYVLWEGAAREIAGRDEEALAGTSMTEWQSGIHPDDRAAALAERDAALERRGRFRFEYRHQRADGSWRHLEERGLVSGDGSLRVFGVLTDVTERRESEEALARLEDRRIGRRRLESLSRLAGDVAHDFDKLLAPVMGYAEMLAFELPEDDPKRADLTEIRDAARQAVDLTRQLLAFGRKLVLELHPTDVNEVVAGVERVLRRVRKEGIAIELRLADELWAVKADRVRLEHALMDLALDAQDAMPDGGVLTLETSNVTVTDEEDRRHEGPTAGPWVRIAVTDTGRGMTDEDVEKAFEPFHSTRERREGRGKGLGLASVYGIVKQHGGEIWASSEPARGTTFLIFLPRARDVAAGTVGEAGGSPPGEETVLVVEEDPSVRRLLCSALASWGFRALEAATAERAMDLASQHRGEIQLLVSDVVLPVSHGTELLRRLRERRPSLKALFITGYGDDMTAAQALRQAGAVLLPKPFSVHLLSHRVRTALHG